jgi:hypothetical protein
MVAIYHTAFYWEQVSGKQIRLNRGHMLTEAVLGKQPAPHALPHLVYTNRLTQNICALCVHLVQCPLPLSDHLFHPDKASSSCPCLNTASSNEAYLVFPVAPSAKSSYRAPIPRDMGGS